MATRPHFNVRKSKSISYLKGYYKQVANYWEAIGHMKVARAFRRPISKKQIEAQGLK